MAATANPTGNKARRIAGRFPDFMQGGGPVFQQLIAALAAPIEELDRALNQVMESHWVERAGGGDLERIGSLFAVLPRPAEPAAAYRRRLMREVATVLRYGCSPRGIFEAAAAALALDLARAENGEAVIQEVDGYRRQATSPDGLVLELEEHPLHTRVETVTPAASGHRFTIINRGHEPRLREPASPTITVAVGAQTVDAPLVVNLSTGEAVAYGGRVPAGGRLVFPPTGSPLLNGQQSSSGHRMTGAFFDHAARFGAEPFVKPASTSPGLPVGESQWAFFTGFDPVRILSPDGQPAMAEVILTWQERLRSAFVLRLPAALKGEDPDEVLDRVRLAIHRVRAAGVSARVEFPS